MRVKGLTQWMLMGVLGVGSVLGHGGMAAEASDLERDFQTPPRQASVRCWWWLNSNVTKEAITRDLEAMHDKGFSGAMIFDAGTELRWGPDQNVPNGPMFSSPEWTELYRDDWKLRRSGLFGPVEIRCDASEGP